MCGRFVRTTSTERLALLFGAEDTLRHPPAPHYNVAPSQAIPTVLSSRGRRLGRLRWGFVPPWAASPDSGPRPINARSEGAVDSRLFGPAVAHRRAIVPIDAWYEWTDEGGARQPWLLTPEPEGPVAVAALWSTWRDPSAARSSAPPLGTVALMTREATGAAATVHHRMPLIVPDDLVGDWLDPDRTRVDDLIAVLAGTLHPLRITRVSRRVNDVRNDDASLIAEVED